jgi:hypothetical protein
MKKIIMMLLKSAVGKMILEIYLTKFLLWLKERGITPAGKLGENDILYPATEAKLKELASEFLASEIDKL